MNLTTDPWIPIVRIDGRTGIVSLSELFEHGHQIQDLAVRPHERIALMRLLICIAQASLDGPADYDDWNACKPRIAPAALDYLQRWRYAFELFGNGQRFLQLGELKKPVNKSNGDEDDEGNSISKLDLALATGNNTTLFDNAGGSERAFSSAQLALNLLSFQCFSPLVGRGYLGRSPCVEENMLHAILRGDTLIETIYLNMIPKEIVARCFGMNGWGKPVWESMPTVGKNDDAVINATRTYLGRLMPVIRAISLDSNGRIMSFGNGLTYPKVRESMASIRVIDKKGSPERVFLRGDLSKAVWRELHAITVKLIDEQGNGGPLALQNLVANKPFDLWVGGLVTDFKAKILDAVEAVFPELPPSMLVDQSQRIYRLGVEHSEYRERALRKAISTYRLAMETSEGDVTGLTRRLTTLNNMERQRLRNHSDKAVTQFWTDIEHHLETLLKVVENPSPLGLKGEWHKTAWGQTVRRASRAAYEHACPRGTARQIRAYALGMNALISQASGQSDNETGKEVEE